MTGRPMNTRRRKDLPIVDSELLQRLMQTMIGQGLKSHFEVPQDMPDDMLILTARIEQQRQHKR